MKRLLFSFFLLTSFLLNAQVFLVFPKQDYVFDQTTITFSWNAVVNASSYHFQLATDADFENIVLEETDLNELELTSPELLANTAYYWRVKADNSPWSNVRLFRIVDFRTWSELKFMLDPDSVVLDVDGNIEQWLDLSGNGHHFGQTVANNRPTQTTNTPLNNQTVVSFNPNTKDFLSGGSFSSLTEGEIFSVLKKNVFPTPSSAKSGIWNFGKATPVDVYPNASNVVSSGFGRSIRFVDVWSPITTDLTEFHVLSIQSSNSFVFSINNNEVFSSTDGAVYFPTIGVIGQSTNNYNFDGQFGQILLFNTVLSDSLRNLVYSQMQSKYAPPVNLGQNITLEFDLCGDLDTLRAAKHFKSYLWSDGSTADTLIVTQAGDYWVEAVDVFGNISRDTIRIAPKLAYPSDRFFCDESSIVWDLSYLDNYSFLWSNGETSSSLEISEVGDYFVTITDTNNCSYTSDLLHFTKDMFPSTASLGPDIDLCVGNQLSLSTGAEEAITYLWSTGATTPEIPLSTSGEYSVVVTNINGCEAKDTVQVNIVGSAPAIAYSIPEMVCLNSEAEFQDASTSTDGSTINTWEWLFLSDTLTSNNGTWQADSVGVFDIHYTIGTTAGCFSDTTFTLTVKPLPIVTMQSQGVCQGDEIQFYAGQLTPTLIDTWEWNFGESGSEAYGSEVEYVFSGNGNTPITLIGTDIYGCSDTLVQEQTISPKPNAAFYYTDICAGEVVNFANQTTIDYPGQLASRQWNFGDGTTSGQNNPQKPYASYGEYPVSLTVVSADGCSDYAEVLLKVNALPQVNYTYQQACARSSTQFTDASFVPNGSVADVKWSFNGQPPLSGFSIANTFNFPGTVQLKQTVKSAFGCSNAKETYITIGPEIYAALSFSPNAFIVDQPVIFSSEGSGETSYAWDFGNGSVAGSSDTTLIFTEDQIGEEVTVTLWVSNAVGCEDSSSVTRIVSGREVDLAIAEVFEYNSAGYSQLGVRLKNVGQAPIESVELSVHKSGFGTFKETWSGNLSPGTEEIYVFSASPAALTSYSSNYQDYLCISGRVLSAYLEEENLENNELCLNLTEDKEMIVVAIPNPIGDELRLRIISETDEVVDVAVFDAMGRKVAFLGEVVVGKGGDEVVVPAGHWAQGVYRVVVGEVSLVVVK